MPAALSLRKAFVLGAGMSLLGLPAAVLYFGAINQILRADVGSALTAVALLFYNLVFLTPLIALLVVSLVFAARSEIIFNRVMLITDRWVRQFASIAIMIVGVVLLADGISWFIGYPFLPVAAM